MDRAFMEEMKKRVEKELQGKEITVIQYWKEEIDKVLRKPSESLSALQLDMKNLSARMENRLKVLQKPPGF
jgi:hypothetical protein